jgi:hypothetical protein
VSRTLLGRCRRLGHCSYIDCICDVDPTDPRDMAALKEEEIMKKPILCLDFDGVLHSYSSGWKGADQIPDPPTPGAMMFLHHAVNYFDVQIYSSRSGKPGGIQAMQDWLNYHVADFFDRTFAGAPSDMDKTEAVLSAISFPTSKPAAFITIDDRALCFTGNWADFYPQDLLEFKPWNKRSMSLGSTISVSRNASLTRRIQTALTLIFAPKRTQGAA